MCGVSVDYVRDNDNKNDIYLYIYQYYYYLILLNTVSLELKICYYIIILYYTLTDGEIVLGTEGRADRLLKKSSFLFPYP